jgi:hypothetical protein
MPDLSIFNTEFRPRSYFVTDPETAVLARIKGAERRDTVRLFGIANVPPDVAAESLEHDQREAAGAFHPSLMGGEYLPDLGDNEVEIARFELESVTSDVISLRARWQGGRIRYRMVDEYDEKYDISPRSSAKPLTFKKLVQLIDREGLPDRVRDNNYCCEGDRAAAERLVTMVRVSSEFYPELECYYDIQAGEWLAEKLRELEGEGAECGEGGKRPTTERTPLRFGRMPAAKANGWIGPPVGRRFRCSVVSTRQARSLLGTQVS